MHTIAERLVSQLPSLLDIALTARSTADHYLMTLTAPDKSSDDVARDDSAPATCFSPFCARCLWAEQSNVARAIGDDEQAAPVDNYNDRHRRLDALTYQGVRAVQSQAEAGHYPVGGCSGCKAALRERRTTRCVERLENMD